MKKPFSNWDSHKTANLLSAISIVAVFVNFVCDNIDRHVQAEKDVKFEKQSYLLNSLSIQPRLALRGLPRPKLAVLAISPIQANLSTSDSAITQRYPHEAEGTIKLTTVLVFENIAKHLAKPILFAHVDTASFTDALRRRILASSPDTGRLLLSDLTRMSDILPSDSMSFEFETELTSFDQRADTLHYFVLYQNELGNYFDTYIWAPIDVGQIYYKTHQIPGTDTVITTRYPKSVLDLVKFRTAPIQEYHTYTSDEAVQVERFLYALDKIHR